MILLLFFLSLCFASPEVPVFRKGKKIRVVMTYGAAVEGWVSRYSTRCIVISNRSGLRELDVRTVESIEIDTHHISQQELLPLLSVEKEKILPPKNSSIFLLGALNAGLPFGLVQKKKESIGLGVLDLAFVGGGIYTFVQQRAMSVPIFIGLIGLRTWSINEVLSRSRNISNLDLADDCTSF